MTRVKKAVNAIKRRRSILKKTKGYRFDRSRKERAAREAIYHSATYSFDHRRDKKGDFRRLWNIRINAATRKYGISYSSFMHTLKEKGSAVNRKMLSEIAKDDPEAFERIIKQTNSVK
ncbi:MAG: 50S ribosomal protein L20 [Candidatus Paceibacterota bacterium]